MIVYRSRGDSIEINILSGERADIIRKTDKSYQIVKRNIYLDQTTLPTDNLSMLI